MDRGIGILKNRIKIAQSQNDPERILLPSFSMIPLVFFTGRKETISPLLKTIIPLAQQLKKNNIPYIAVLTEPTTGGVTASFAMLGDITIAEQGSTIGFAGKRVIQDTIREELPIDFQKAEYLKEHGMVDIVTHRKDLKKTLISILNHLQ